jgi:hypothetical protein
MNHVPDAALSALDAFGRGLLVGAVRRVDERLRTDLRLTVEPPCANGDGPRPAAGDAVARCRYRTDHTTAPPALRDRGPFVATIVDNVDDRLRSWGVDPPPAYEHVESVDNVHRYAGVLRGVQS